MLANHDPGPRESDYGVDTISSEERIRRAVELLAELALDRVQAITVGGLMNLGMPREVAILMALTAPSLVIAALQSRIRRVALYRLGKLIGVVAGAEWEKLKMSMRRGERDNWRAKASVGN